MDASKILDFIKLKPQYALPVFMATGAVLFFPEEWLTTLGLKDIRDDWKVLLGVAFLLSASILATYVVFGCKGFLAERWMLKRKQRGLHALTPDQKKILREYIDRQSKTQSLPCQNGVVSSLVAEKIICQSTAVPVLGTIYAYRIQEWAWEYLTKHRELLKTEEELTES